MKRARTIALAAALGLILSGALLASLAHQDTARGSPDGLIGTQVLPRVVDEARCALRGEFMCLWVVTGTGRAVYRISSPEGIAGYQDRELANYTQRLVGSTDTSIDVEVTARHSVHTGAPYPLDLDALPEAIRAEDLRPEPGWIQSADPAIAALAGELVQGATRQAEAVEAILAWVRAHVQYDYAAPANDALSVLQNRRAVCAGFSTLSVALLRAAGIPARYHVGCATPFGYITDQGGGWHAWVEAYYPDVGWVASEPQSFVNGIDAEVIFGGFDQCGRPGTVISRTHTSYQGAWLEKLQSPYGSEVRSFVRTAEVPAWDRHPLRVTPRSPGVTMTRDDPRARLVLQVANERCQESDWQVRTEAPWLAPRIVTGSAAGETVFTVDARGLPLGVYSAPLTVYGTSSQDAWDVQNALSRTVTVRLWVVEEMRALYLPAVLKIHHRNPMP